MSNETNGIVIVDKPVNVSSARVVSRIKQLFGARKVGHTGTLDPMATGILICCLNDATRIARFFLGADKTYEAVLSLGVETDTQDATGTVIATSDAVDVPRHTIESVMKQFTGAIQQKPPVYSALKHKGVPLYKLARKGNPIQKPARQVVISEICLRQIALPEIIFNVSCSAGTYVRTLCADMGAALGCGGNMKALKRIESCGFTLEDAASLPELEEFARAGTLGDCVMGMAEALSMMPTYSADAPLTGKIRHGIQLTHRDICLGDEGNTAGYMKIVDENDALIAVISHTPSGDRYQYCCVFQD